MKCFTVNSCCCFDLKTGGLIVGYIQLFYNVILFFKCFEPFWVFCISLISVLAVVGWLYGIHKNNVKAMLLDLVLSMALTILCMGILVAIPTAAIFGANLIDAMSSAAYDSLRINTYRSQVRVNVHEIESEVSAGKSILGGVIFVVWIIIAVPVAIYWYCTSVKYSLYMSMKNELGRAPDQGSAELSNINLPTAPPPSFSYSYTVPTIDKNNVA